MQPVAPEMKVLCIEGYLLQKKQQLCISYQEDTLPFVHSACYYGLAQHVLEITLARYISRVQVT